MDKRKQGTDGETLACEYLVKNGYEIIKRNYFTRYGEIDIVAAIEDVLIFIEVKMRNSDAFGIGAEAVTKKKIERIRTCAQLYMQSELIQNQNVRFDVIDIMGQGINHIKGAF